MREHREFQLPVGATDSAGDTHLSVVEWAGADDPILLLHATGFHSRCWNEVVKRLPNRHIYAVDLRFHGKSGDNGPVSWSVMADDIRALVETLELENILAVGHSLGGRLLARLAAQLPQVFKHLILIDPVIFSPKLYDRLSAQQKKLSAADHRVSKRRNSWRDADELFESFQTREPFNSWQPEVLRDYCDHALKPDTQSGTHSLACAPINEASIYLGLDGSKELLDMLPSIITSTTLLRAPQLKDDPGNFAGSPTWRKLASIIPNCEEFYLPDHNHFIPMQDPQLVADHILRALHR